MVTTLRHRAGRICAWSALVGVALFPIVACDSSYNVDAADDGADGSAGGGGDDGATSSTDGMAGGQDTGAVTPRADAGEAGEAGAPSPVDVGSGMDGAFAPIGGMATINNQCFMKVSGTAGATVLTGIDHNKASTSNAILVYVPQGANAGTYEWVSAVASSGGPPNQVTLKAPLEHTYTNAIAFLAKQYTTVTIPTGLTLNGNPWNGSCGGVLVFKATGAVNIAGKIDMTGRGYRGNSHAGTCGGAVPYVCNQTTKDTGSANGFSGESEVGPSSNNYLPNGMGGGGGQDGDGCGQGGGGGHGVAGQKGANGGGANCRTGTQQGGQGGNVAGTADLSSQLFFGGAGGEGGGDDDGAYPGAGGNGGGIIVIDAQSIAVTGSILANGAAGSDGVQNDPTCGGGGTGMGGGGGGAGGSIRLGAVTSATIGTGLVSASAGAAGHCATPAKPSAGTGAQGRVSVRGPSVSGTSLPTFDPR